MLPADINKAFKRIFNSIILLSLSWCPIWIALLWIAFGSTTSKKCCYEYFVTHNMYQLC